METTQERLSSQTQDKVKTAEFILKQLESEIADIRFDLHEDGQITTDIEQKTMSLFKTISEINILRRFAKNIEL